MITDILPWVLFVGFIIGLLSLDLFVFHRKSHVISIKEALAWSVFWETLALLFNIYIYYARGLEVALNFLTGYVIEKSLSVDNLFVFLLIFKYFKTPESVLHKVLFWGVLGAIVMRALFIAVGIFLITQFHWMIYVFGFFLIITGIKFAMEKEKEVKPERNPILRIFRYFFHVTNDYEGDKFFVLKQARYYATPLFVVLIAIETTDVIFAVDSIPAILAITFDPFIVFTSNIFAILGLRSLYFVLSHMMMLFHYLHYGLSIILIFIGMKMMIADLFKIPTLISLGIVLLVLMFSVVFSILFPEKPRNKEKR